MENTQSDLNPNQGEYQVKKLNNYREIIGVGVSTVVIKITLMESLRIIEILTVNMKTRT
jgi:hypothetical protein